MKQDNKQDVKRGLFATTVLAGLAMAMPAMAQQTPAPTPAPAPAAAGEDEIVVTGTLFRRTDALTTSPVTIVDQENLEARGISTIQDAIQQLASNGGPALTNSFSANGAFAAGASGASLRGLSVSSTLVLFDGLRAAYYPLADDGSRNFVDLNTIPDDIVERLEVLRDGASATYGADAIAGVVNLITKREFQGLTVRGEGGLSQQSDAGQAKFSVTAGIGDIDEDGINAYISIFGYHSDQLRNSDRPYPFNSDDSTGICYQGHCGGNGVVNGIQPSGTFALSTAANFLVRPYDATNTTALGRWQALNSSCGPGTSVALTVAQQGTANPASVCQYDYTKLYGVIQPEVERFGLSGHVAGKVGDDAEAYLEVNFLQSKVDYTGFPASVRAVAPTGIYFPQFSTSDAALNRAPGSLILNLPVYVCPERVNCATSPNRTLNPNNPFAASNQVARLIGRDVNEVTYNETRNRAYRAAMGINGTFNDNWTFDIGATAMHTDLQRTQDGYVYIQHLLDVINDGTYNFRNPAATPQSVLNYLKPQNRTNATSDLIQLQGSVSVPLLELPGGPLELAVGASARYEAVDAPSGNSDINGPTQRYFTLNAFGTSGERRVYSEFFELNAPILDQVEINASGRYDDYSSGQSHFSPKIGIKYTPFDQVTLRGTYSEGFRIPSFAEANALPTTGYVTNNVSLFNNTYLAQYGCTTATFTTCPTYIRSGSYGQTTLASPNLDPEESKSFTVGFVVEPLRNFAVTLDYYNIEKTGAITTPSNAPALAAYYNNQAIPAGYVVIPDAPDPAFPAARPRVAFVQSSLVNADTIKTEGYDIGITFDRDLTGSVHLNSSLDVTFIKNLSTEFQDGTVERYDGTLGNFNLTAGSGTPKWHGNWVNTFDVGIFQLSSTVNWFGGYDLSATDQGTGYKDCGLSSGITPCRVDDYFTYDLNGRAHVTENLTLFATVLNVTDELPPIDPVTYGAQNYNPVQGGNGILGRYFKVGFKAEF